MAKTVYVHLRGMEELTAALQGLPLEMRETILAEATSAAGEVLKQAARKFARRSVRTGALYASIDKVTRKYAGGTAVTVVGPSRDYFTRGGRKVDRFGDRRGSEQPSRYAHLVEFGHAVAKGGSLRPSYKLELVGIGKFSRNGKELKRWRRGSVKAAAKGAVVGWVAPRPFMRPALATSRNEVARKLTAGVGAGLEKARKKLVKNKAHVA